MAETSFVELLDLAKRDSNYLLQFIKRYEPLIVKYSIINGMYHEDLHSLLIETTIRAVKNFRYDES